MRNEKDRVAMTSVAAAIFLTTMKLVIGLATGSLGILSEAAHSGLDLVAAVVTAVAVRISGRPADPSHNYGHGKVENFSALFETLLLLFTCGWIIYEASHRMLTGNYAVEATIWSFLVMGVSITVDFNRSRMLYRAAHKHQSQALEADALHFSSDIWSSCVVILGLALVKLGVPVGDSVAAMGVAVLVVIVSLRLAKRAIDALLDAAPIGVREKAKSAILSIEGIDACPVIRARQSGATIFIDAQVEVAQRVPSEKIFSLMASAEQAVADVLPGADVAVRPVVSRVVPAVLSTEKIG